jgi:hypothetical protein
MEWRVTYLALLAVLFPVQHAVLQAQAGSGGSSISIVESRTRAVLGEKSIRLELPLAAPAAGNERIVAWLLSPSDLKSSETDTELKPRAQAASLLLPWPGDGNGNPVDQIGWYRIAYQIEKGGAPVGRGILSVGAIAPNLMALRLARPLRAVAGMPISVRVFAGNSVTWKPLGGVHLKATLTFDRDADNVPAAKQPAVREAVTAANGEATFSFPGPRKPGETATVNVEGALGTAGDEEALAHASLSSEIETDDRAVIQAETDKPLHKPGETVHLRALVLNDAGYAAADTELTLTIRDSEGKTVEEVPLTTNAFGIASYDWKTGQHTATGDYEASFEIAIDSDYEGTDSIPLRIERYDLPEFVVTAATDRGFYLKGQAPTVKIHSDYLFGKAVASGTVRIARKREERWNPKTRKMEETENPELTGSLDSKGDTELKLDVKKDFDELRLEDYRRYTDLQYRATVTDASTGRSEPRNFTVRLSHDPVHIYVTSAGGNDREGDYLVSTSYADGVPAPCKLTLGWIDEKDHLSRAAALTTNRYGLGKVHLSYPSRPAAPDSFGGVNLRLTAVDREGRTSKFDDTLNPGSAGAAWITVTHSLLRPGEPIEATVHGATSDPVDVDVVSQAGVLAHLQVHPVHGIASLSVPAGPNFRGLITLHAYTLNRDVAEYEGEYGGVASSKSVLYPEDRELRVKLSGLQTSYPPGAEVNANLNVNDVAGVLQRGAAGISVFDTAVEQRASTEAEANEHWFGGYWWMNGSQAGGVTRAMLEKTDTSKPIPADLDLAGEAVLAENGEAVPISIEGGSDAAVRAEFTRAMESNLKPVGDAIVAFPTVRLPRSLDWIREIVRTAKLDPGLLIDPWNTPYSPEYTAPWNDEVLTFTSAGPDKRFGTGDDMSIVVARRNIFAAAGRRLTEILQRTAAADEPLPGTPDALKALAKSSGLDLNSAGQGTLDLDGKPFKYVIDVGRFYSIEVRRGDVILVWRSPEIDYFSRNEASMDNALRLWTARGKPFPNSESEARQAFSAAGIHFDSLRDPFGKPFQIRSMQMTTYTRNVRVKGSSDLQASNKPVTHLMCAIQVVRSLDPHEPAGQNDVIAQFLYPMTEQSGSDLRPHWVDQGAFKGNTGAIGGTVTDVSGAVVSDATITATSGGGKEFTAKTLEDGTYLLRDLVPGLYSVTVAARGFQSFSVRDVSVSSASLTTVDVELTVGATAETIEVSAAGVTLNTSTAQVASFGVKGTSKKSVVTTATGSATISEPTFTPRLRHVFEETAYWAPSLETDTTGKAALRFRLPDSLTTWKLHTVVSTADGRMGALDQTFKTFQPFFVDLDAPQVLTQGDKITLPVNLRNYTAQNLALPVSVKPAGWLETLTPTTLHVNVPANGSTPVTFGFRAAKTIAQGPLQITASAARTGDAVEKQIRVHPDGEPGSANVSALLRGEAVKLQLDLPANLIPGSLHADLRVYPNLSSQIVHSIKAALERPYGCGEQTISSTYPSLLFLELLKASHSKSPLESEAQNYLELGYNRLLSYFDSSGGLTYWGGNDHDPDPALTAYGVTFLLEADGFIKVDRERSTRAIRWLLEHQQADGAWKPQYGSPKADVVLYVAAALSVAAASPGNDAAQELNPRIKTSVAKAIAWAAKSAASVHDPYVNALRLQLADWSGEAETIHRLRNELAFTAVRDRSGAHWTRDTASPFYGWGRAGDLETTAIALSALRRAAPGAAEAPIVNDVLLFLLGSHDGYGIWYTGQATVRVLQALLPFAVEQMKNPAASANFSLAINGSPLGGKDAEALRADPRLLEAPRSLDVISLLKPGRNELVFTDASDIALASAEISTVYYTPWTADLLESPERTQPGKDYGLDFGYKCAATEARAGSPIQCALKARRFGSGGFGMLLAEVGLPPGVDVDRVSLAKLLDNWTISRYELQPDRIVFYLWSWNAEGTHFNFAFTPRYAIQAKAAPAVLFDYYNPDLRVVLAPQTFVVH